MYCSKCGNLIQEGDRFCARCGKRVDNETLVCGKCGKQLPFDARFCDNCGEPTQVRPSDFAGGGESDSFAAKQSYYAKSYSFEQSPYGSVTITKSQSRLIWLTVLAYVFAFIFPPISIICSAAGITVSLSNGDAAMKKRFIASMIVAVVLAVILSLSYILTNG